MAVIASNCLSPSFQFLGAARIGPQSNWASALQQLFGDDHPAHLEGAGADREDLDAAESVDLAASNPAAG
jgi:hypothetical protein